MPWLYATYEQAGLSADSPASNAGSGRRVDAHHHRLAVAFDELAAPRQVVQSLRHVNRYQRVVVRFRLETCMTEKQFIYRNVQSLQLCWYHDKETMNIILCKPREIMIYGNVAIIVMNRLAQN